MNTQVFLALATVAWANGDLSADERAGILNAARSAGYSEQELAVLAKAIETPRELSSLSLQRLSALDRVFTFAAAEWLARLEGKVGQQEAAALKALGDFLKLSEAVRAKARQAVQDIAKLPTGDKPDRYDFVKLREVLERSMQTKAG
jgi:uncharacterized membrane protein YebE (DUF533 family)